MSYFFKQLKRNAEVLFITLLLVAALFSLLSYVGTFPNDFMPVIGHLFLMLFEIGLLITVPVLLLLRKRELAKMIYMLYASFWVISTIYTALGDSIFIAGGNHGLLIAASVFEFLIAAALLTAAVFFILGKKKQDVKKNNLTALILLGAYAAFFIVFALGVAYFAVFRQPWTNYIQSISGNLFLPAAMFLGLFVFGFLSVSFPEKPIVIAYEEEGEEENEESSDTSDTIVEEAPAEEPAEVSQEETEADASESESEPEKEEKDD